MSHSVPYYHHPPPQARLISQRRAYAPSPARALSWPKPTTSIPPKLIRVCQPGLRESHSTRLQRQSYYASLIQSCIDSGSFDAAKAAHSQLLAEGLAPDAFLQTKILMLYARSGQQHDLATARQLFGGMLERNSTAWNTMILAYAQADDHLEVLNLFSGMQDDGISPDEFTFPSVIKACVALDDEGLILQVHSLVVKCGLARDVVVGTVLINGYAEFGLVGDARTLFYPINSANAITWNALIGGYVRYSWWEESWDAFVNMQKSGVCPNHFTLGTMIQTCGDVRSSSKGKQLHAKAIICGYQGDVFVGNSLIDMYARCEDMESSVSVFDLMAERNQVSWNSIISTLARLGHHEEALNMLHAMLESGYTFDLNNLGSGIMACTGLADVNVGQKFHGYVVRRLLGNDVVLGSGIVDMYSKCGFMEEARRVFSKLEERNVVSWNALLSGYVKEGQADVAINLYHEMEAANVKPDQFTLASLLSLCGDRLNEGHGKEIHSYIVRTVSKPNMVLETELVQMYAQCGRLKDAQNVLARMPDRNNYSWNALIEGCKQTEVQSAFELFHQMQLNGIPPDSFSLASVLSASTIHLDLNKGKQIHGYIIRNTLEDHCVLCCMVINMYSECGQMNYASKIYEGATKKDVYCHNAMIRGFVVNGEIERARRIFDKMEDRNKSSWSSMLVGYARYGLEGEAFTMIKQLIKIDIIDYDLWILTPMFSICASLACHELGKQLHSCVIKNGLACASVALDTSVVNMYVRGGMIQEARRCFDQMDKRNVISWNAIISGYAKHGENSEVFALFDRMWREGVCPNEVTYLAVLSACSHTGLLDEGIDVFASMLAEGLEARTEHYTCMVDLLGRAGLLEDAKELIAGMPIEPEVSTWGALLGACRIHANVDIGKMAAEKLLRLDPNNTGYQVLMANMYASTGRKEKRDEIRKAMKARRMKKDPGVSWIQIGNQMEVFHAGHGRHPGW